MRPPVFVALDVNSAGQAQALVDQLGEQATHYKVGLQLYLAAGRPFVESLLAQGKRIFLDLKFHDIPNTVEHAVEQAAQLGVDLCTVHALAGAEALRRAVAAADRVTGGTSPRMGILAVTLLTSVNQSAANAMGFTGEPLEQVIDRLAALAAESGAHGIVCSAHEVVRQKRAWPALRALVPGIRPLGSESADQARTASPSEALRQGADYLVIGRPITGAPDPALALAAILRELDEG